MKTEFVDVNETRKNVRVEIPSDVVDAEIERVARGYSRTAKVPGFRPGKTPPRVIKQRFKDQILHEVAHDRFRARWAMCCASAASSRSTHRMSAT